MKTRITHLGVVAMLAILFAASSYAGPPLICHPFQTGNAKSLPWASTGKSWNEPLSSYDTRRLVLDTTELLTPSTPVLARMETLRRAAIYGRKDSSAGQDLLVALRNRMNSADKASKALAMFDYGYLVETYKQLWEATALKSTAAPIDGVAEITKAIQMRGGDAEMEFAAAVATEGQKNETHETHLRNAAKGAAPGSLLARNLSSHFSNRAALIASLAPPAAGTTAAK